jgi:hypothetical protein
MNKRKLKNYQSIAPALARQKLLDLNPPSVIVELSYPPDAPPACLNRKDIRCGTDCLSVPFRSAALL